jgi:cytochrome c-type biogenesis protein CcmH
MGVRRVGLCLGACALALACDRKIEPLDPNETPREPELSRIFPAGADRAAAAEGAAPEAPAGPAGGRAAPPVAAAGAPVRGTVELAPGLAERVPPGAVLFLIARREGGGPPLAVRRIDAPRFPLEFELGPDDRMIESMPFAGPLRLSARLDADGNATTRAAGDLEGAAPAPVEPGATGVRIAIAGPGAPSPGGPAGR